jgi:hypothetical protein
LRSSTSKTSPRPTDSPTLLEAYERQLCTYAHILERRDGRTVDRLLLYWTAEPEKDKALMTLPYRPDRIEEAGRHFDEVVKRIQAEEFRVIRPPEAGICKECDLRALCAADGTLQPAETGAVMIQEPSASEPLPGAAVGPRGKMSRQSRRRTAP